MAAVAWPQPLHLHPRAFGTLHRSFNTEGQKYRAIELLNRLVELRKAHPHAVIQPEHVLGPDGGVVDSDVHAPAAMDDGKLRHNDHSQQRGAARAAPSSACPACGVVTSSEDRFCGNCGAGAGVARGVAVPGAASAVAAAPTTSAASSSRPGSGDMSSDPAHPVVTANHDGSVEHLPAEHLSELVRDDASEATGVTPAPATQAGGTIT